MACAASHTHAIRLISPSDFYLFPIVKEKLERIQMADEDQFFDCVREISSDINRDELNGLFHVCVQLIHNSSLIGLASCIWPI
jgi:hypothetical protein